MDAPETNNPLVNWIIGILTTSLVTVIGTVVLLARYIESKYLEDLRVLRTDVDQLKKHVAECNDEKNSHAIELARLKALLEKE